MLILGIVVTVVAVFVVICLLIDRIASVPSYHGPITDHFDGNRFHNVEPPERTIMGKCGLKCLSSAAKEWLVMP